MEKKDGKNPQSKNLFPAMEEEVLNFWEENKIFEKSVEKGKKDYIFYDGPPFATGTPHYGHIVASLMKDIVPRYWTMKGYRVERKWGWDCHGLPIENIVEKEMKTKSKKDIEKMGVDKFNEQCRSKVLVYAKEWEKTVRRMGRWVDMKNAYKTMDLDYMESVWWVFKQLWDKGLIYKDYRSMHICPRCETTLSQSEVAEGYKMVKDLSVTVKFEVTNANELKTNLTSEDKVYLLAWTTTPWTLIGNVALAVGEKIDYVIINYEGYQQILEHTENREVKEFSRISKGTYILAKDIVWNNLQSNAGLMQEVRLLVGYYSNDEMKGDLLKNIAPDVFFKKYSFKIIKGKDLVGLEYKPLFKSIEVWFSRDSTPLSHLLKTVHSGKRSDILDGQAIQNKRGNINKKIFKIYSANFVNTDEGTGIVHIAPAFGEDDFNLAKKEEFNVMIQHVKINGRLDDINSCYYPEEETQDWNQQKWEQWRDLIIDKQESRNGFIGKEVKPKDNPQATDVEIIEYLKKQNLLFSEKEYEHSYPHCWRCETPLLNYATSSWFVKITEIKKKMLKLAKEINWVPAHIKEGRFGNWLEGARDWSISRQRFWASVIPIWECACGERKVIGSVEELEKLSGQKITDLHKHIVDKITFKCEKCGGEMKRVSDVLDTWFDSGSMPYAQMHYPFENKKKFEANFPAEFIAEGVDQTRAWFYYLHAIATGIKKSHAFKNVVVNGIVLAEDGKKMSKRLNNYPDPMEVMDKYGADPLRYYLCASPVMKADNINFSEKDMAEQTRFFNILLNVLSFYKMFAGDLKVENLDKKDLVNVLDKWITARLEQTKQIITEKMDNYDLHAIREIPIFINDLSTWYVRRSRDRFKGDDQEDKMRALKTLRRTLYHLARIMAPFLPFTAEHIYQELGADVESVHLKEWAPVKKEWIDKDVLENMEMVKKIVELGLAKRDEAGIKVRQPLNELRITNYELRKEYEELVKDELNIKEVKFVKGDELAVELDTEMTPELVAEGVKRELTRAINNLRKETGMTIQDRAVIYYQTENKEIKEVFEKFGEEIKKDTLAKEIQVGGGGKVVKINGEEIKLKVEKK
ncbi:MAG: class I tRNA ligase family protein [Patescibacteria group bacterium]|nr:class I tRNA ligase family protein [Patescibacteria group bacterium]